MGDGMKRTMKISTDEMALVMSALQTQIEVLVEESKQNKFYVFDKEQNEKVRNEAADLFNKINKSMTRIQEHQEKIDRRDAINERIYTRLRESGLYKGML